MRRPLVPLLLPLVLLAACARPGAGQPPARDAHAAQLAQARAALDRWAAAAGDGPPFVPAAAQTGQAGDWEPGTDFKESLLAGAVEVTGELPSAPPPPGEIVWQDGRRRPAGLLTAAQALDRLRADGSGKCADSCPPIPVTGATLATTTLTTSRGPATVPVWQYTVRGSAAKIWRVAVDSTTPPPGPHDPNNPPAGVSAERATIQGRTLTVYFTGAQGPASTPCGVDYTPGVLTSDVAVVVLIDERQYEPPPGEAGHYGCADIGYQRSASVELPEPLGDRVVLEVRYGTAIPVTPA
ncbi:hypothetical protein [Dactylosporangium sp. CA-139066]|uniref:hypothetical protein n=1 Tax=Dactylosporangium sp. CA-139066 TaxID=3239930 RepID=UPI003D928C01